MIRAVNVALWFYWNSFPLEIIRQQSWELLKRGGKCYHINCDGKVIGVNWGNIFRRGIIVKMGSDSGNTRFVIIEFVYDQKLSLPWD